MAKAWTAWFDERGMPAAQIWIDKNTGALIGPSISFAEDDGSVRCGFAIKENGAWREATKAEYEQAALASTPL
jgi:hypothetical protein